MTADLHARHSSTLRVPLDHPALAGHFPGNPVVPGVVILDAVIAAAESWLGTPLHVAELPQAKFLAPLKPDESACIEFEGRGPLIQFAVHRGMTVITKGTLRRSCEAPA